MASSGLRVQNSTAPPTIALRWGGGYYRARGELRDAVIQLTPDFGDNLVFFSSLLIGFLGLNLFLALSCKYWKLLNFFLHPSLESGKMGEGWRP